LNIRKIDVRVAFRKREGRRRILAAFGNAFLNLTQLFRPDRGINHRGHGNARRLRLTSRQRSLFVDNREIRFGHFNHSLGKVALAEEYLDACRANTKLGKGIKIPELSEKVTRILVSEIEDAGACCYLADGVAE
jgi:hypothetical protein